MKLQGKNIVITGISRGIGKALTAQLLDKGANVWGWGRNKGSLSHENLHFIPCDVRNQSEVNRAAEKTLEKANARIDGLINNSGLGYFGFLEEMDDSEIRQMVDVNLYGTIYVTKALLGAMKEKRSGHIINISSIAGLEAYQQVSVYSATKFAITGFTDALYKELRDFGIKVTSVHPGSTQTNFFDNVETITAHDNMISPEEAAGQIVFALESSDNFLPNRLIFRPLNPKPKA